MMPIQTVLVQFYNVSNPHWFSRVMALKTGFIINSRLQTIGSAMQTSTAAGVLSPGPRSK